MTPPDEPLGLDGVNALSDRAREELLRKVCTSPAWVEGVAAGAPFGHAADLIARADRVLEELSDTELDAALAGHPRIGARADNHASAREQSGVAGADAGVLARLATGNRDYEERFGYVYLVCASGRSAEDLLAVLTERLANDPATERAVMRAELGKINRLRLQRLLNEPENA